MSKTNDGGPAFPSMEHAILQTGRRVDDLADDLAGKNVQLTHYKQDAVGMSLRDYFAAKAMQGLATSNRDDDAIAAVCYQLADAMLAAREAK